MSDSAYDIFLDHCIDEHYEDAEEDSVDDDDWMVDVFVEDQIERESFDD
jgi:hypothetical protein